MAEESAKLRIPYIAAAQAQKHVTHNEAITLLDTLVQLAVLDKDLTAPPSEPEEGDTYIVAASATGAWEGWDKRIARFIDGTWRSYLPGAGAGAGWLAYVIDEAALYVFNGTSWTIFSGGGGGAGPTADVLASGSLPAANSISITDIDYTVYRALILAVLGLSHGDTGNPRLGRLLISTNNGGTFPTSNYLNTLFHNTGSQVATAAIGRGVVNVAHTVATNVVIYLTGLQAGAYPMAFTLTNDDAGNYGQELGVYIGSTDGVNAVLFGMNNAGAAFDAGTYALIGLK